MYLEEDVKGFHREDYYLAQIAAEVRRGIVTDPKKVEVTQFLIDFSPAAAVEVVDGAKEKRVRESKGFWLVGMGIKEF